MVFVFQYISAISTKTITTKDITDLDMRETKENTFIPNITLEQLITTESVTITEIPTMKMTLRITSNATPTSDLCNFKRRNRY